MSRAMCRTPADVHQPRLLPYVQTPARYDQSNTSRSIPIPIPNADVCNASSRFRFPFRSPTRTQYGMVSFYRAVEQLYKVRLQS
jgi:hypothetical protein